LRSKKKVQNATIIKADDAVKRGGDPHAREARTRRHDASGPSVLGDAHRLLASGRDEALGE
jgi:hypothetical protein